MEKVRDLLKQLGGSPELVEEIIKHMQDFQNKCVEEANAKLQERCLKAKQICAEHVQNEKTKLARKVEIFLEARINSINREAQKQAAIGESEAVKTLTSVKNMLTGVNNDGNTEGSQAAVAENKKLRVMVSAVSEERDNAKEAAKRANVIATKALQRNKMLEGRGVETPTAPAATAEGAVRTGTTLNEARTPAATPVTTRKPINETQTPAPKKDAAAQPEIAAIAEGLDGLPAYAK